MRTTAYKVSVGDCEATLLKTWRLDHFFDTRTVWRWHIWRRGTWVGNCGSGQRRTKRAAKRVLVRAMTGVSS